MSVRNVSPENHEWLHATRPPGLTLSEHIDASSAQPGSVRARILLFHPLPSSNCTLTLSPSLISSPESAASTWA